MKGDFKLNPIFFAILGLIFLVVVAGINAGAGGPLGFISEWFDSLFGRDATSEEYGITTASVEALVCAMNAVANGEQNACGEFSTSSEENILKSIPPGDVFDNRLSFQTTYDEIDPFVSCTDTSEYKCCEGDFTEWNYEWKTTIDDCAMSGGEPLNCGGTSTGFDPLTPQQAPPIGTCVGPDLGRCCCRYMTENLPYKWNKGGCPIGNVVDKSDCQNAGLSDPPFVMECQVENFQLVQDVTSAEDWIGWFGDPYFLVYWQKFPIEEDTWTFSPNWKTYVVLGVISIIPPFKAGKIVLGTTLRTVLTKVFQKGGAELVEAVVKKSVTSSTIKKTMRKEITKYIKKGYLTKTEGGDLLKRITSKDLKAVIQKIDADMAGKWGDDVFSSTGVAKTYASKIATETLRGAGWGVITPELREKIEKQATEAAYREVLKYMGKEGMKEQLLDLVKTRLVGKQVPKTLLRFGAFTTAAHAVAMVDNMTQARFEEYPGQIVLKPAMDKPITFDLEGKASGMPIFIAAKNRDNYLLVGPQLGAQEVLFHMASPCYLDDIKVKNTYADCPMYIRTDTEDVRMTECGGDIEIDDDEFEQTTCTLNTYDTGDFGPFEFLETTTEIPEFMTDLYDADEYGNYYKIPISENMVYKHYPFSPAPSYVIVTNGDQKTEYEFSPSGGTNPDLEYVESIVAVQTYYDEFRNPDIKNVHGDGRIEVSEYMFEIKLKDEKDLTVYIIKDLEYEEKKVVIYVEDTGTFFPLRLDSMVVLSDEGDFGTLHTIDLMSPHDWVGGAPEGEETWGSRKYLFDDDFERPGLDSYILYNCKVDALLVEMGDKVESFDDNYCTGGYSTTDAWIEWGGDVFAIGGAVVSYFVTGPIATIIWLGVGGLADVGTEAYVDYSATWPDSW